MSLSNHVVIVTGAGSGIGRGIALRFAEEGAAVVLADVNRSQGEAAAQACEAAGGRALFVATDVSKAADCRMLVQKSVAAFEKVDTLVNNAGVNFVKPTLAMDEADWDRVIDVDLKGTFLCSRYVLEVMVPRSQGNIINIVDERVLNPSPAYFSYFLSKSVLWTATQTLAQSLVEHCRTQHQQLRQHTRIPTQAQSPVEALLV